ncbi:hypothetical protein AAFF_G00168120 [Aldrovandia affinis]|uniref:UHRF1-binding protein 1-like n=1 Tax=Aldrovandia affinis TaxID=143900 RepID=A0AAD7W739_9TELE|nr:hypothetical protein AAFF_G00168120 [Aldrovandia affinis]
MRGNGPATWHNGVSNLSLNVIRPRSSSLWEQEPLTIRLHCGAGLNTLQRVVQSVQRRHAPLIQDSAADTEPKHHKDPSHPNHRPSCYHQTNALQARTSTAPQASFWKQSGLLVPPLRRVASTTRPLSSEPVLGYPPPTPSGAVSQPIAAPDGALGQSHAGTASFEPRLQWATSAPVLLDETLFALQSGSGGHDGLVVLNGPGPLCAGVDPLEPRTSADRVRLERPAVRGGVLWTDPNALRLEERSQRLSRVCSGWTRLAQQPSAAPPACVCVRVHILHRLCFCSLCGLVTPTTEALFSSVDFVHGSNEGSEEPVDSEIATVNELAGTLACSFILAASVIVCLLEPQALQTCVQVPEVCIAGAASLLAVFRLLQVSAHRILCLKCSRAATAEQSGVTRRALPRPPRTPALPQMGTEVERGGRCELQGVCLTGEIRQRASSTAASALLISLYWKVFGCCVPELSEGMEYTLGLMGAAHWWWLRFAKNLSPDKINLSTLKGEGQLTNLELDEEVLQNMLDLPTWLAINKVACNKAAIRIPWTKLKTHPISLSLDKVVMEMSTCDEPRPPNGPSPIATVSGQSEYGFAEKVVEGISLSISSIVIRISAKAFNASFELSQLQVYSVNTSWATSDLRFTRIVDPQRGELLTFKEISWQMIRIEADAIQSADHNPEVLSAPIRLITNQSRIRVTLKRRMKDCNVVASKLVLILDDLLWVLTDSQLKAMVQYAKSLGEVMEKSAQQRKSTASETSQGAVAAPSSQQVRAQQTSVAADQNATIARLFSTYDVCETSHHLQIAHLDLHICDDIHAKERVLNKRITGGAMQLSFSLITMDYYPFHRAGEGCLHWMHYSEATKSRESWARSLLDEFKANVEMLKNAVKDHQSTSSSPQGSPQHGKISTTSTSTFSTPSPPPKTQLMSSSIVLRMADFSIYQVSTADQRRSSPKAMISCNKKSLYLPQEMPAVHMEFTEYYFPDGKDYPIPCPNLYVQLNALQLVLDPRSLIWLNQFGLDLRQSLEQFMELYKLDDTQKPDEHMDVRVDGLMLKLVVPADQEPTGDPDLPRCVSIQTSEMVATNTRHPPGCTRSSLEALLLAFQQEELFSPAVLHPLFQRHAHEQDTRLHDVYRGLAPAALTADALKTPAATDVWALRCSQFWVDYEGMRSGRGRPVPCVDSFPLSVWACQPARCAQYHALLRGGARATLPRSASAESATRLQRKRLLKEYYASEEAVPPGQRQRPPPQAPLAGHADVQVLVHVQKGLSAQVSHQQYVFLLRLQQSIRGLQQTLRRDTERVGSARRQQDRERERERARPFGVCVGVLLKSAEVALLLRPVPQAPAATPPPTGGPGSPLEPDLRGGGAEPAVPGSVDELLCGGEGGFPQGPAPLNPSPSCPDGPIKGPLLEKGDWEESTGAGSGGGAASEEEKQDSGEDGGREEQGGSSNCRASGRPGAGDPLLDPFTKDLGDGKDKLSAARMPQSMSSGRLPRDRSQSNFAVSYKNLKKSPSLHSLDNISIDSYLLEDCDTYSLLERDGVGDDISISGFKDMQGDQSGAESASEALGQNMDGGISPDTVSATSQSIDEPTKDLVSVLVLKVQSVCGELDVQGDDTAVSLQLGQVLPTQLGNISVRQYLSNRSLGAVPGAAWVDRKPRPEVRVRLESGPRAAAHSPLAANTGFLQCHLHDFRSDFLMSSLRNLGHFLQDDSTSHILPMKIDIRDMHVNLKDDAPRDNPSDPEPTPITLHIDNLLIHRQDDGSFSIGVTKPPAPGPQSEQSVEDEARPRPVPETPTEVTRVAQATQTSPQPPVSTGPPSRETLLVEENECLKLELSRTKMALAEAQMEKDSLLHRMKSLKLTPGGRN